MTEHKEKAQHWYIRRAVSYGLTISCLHDESFHEADFKERSGCHYEETLFVSQNHAVLKAARVCGMRTVYFDERRSGIRPAEADTVVYDLRDLLRLSLLKENDAEREKALRLQG